jgi:hypothetical protein
MLTQHLGDAFPPEVEGFRAATVLHDAERAAKNRLGSVGDRVRESPGTSVLCAIALGYFLRQVPIGTFLGGIARLLAAFARPAILLFGAAKLFEFLQREARGRRQRKPPRLITPNQKAPPQ